MSVIFVKPTLKERIIIRNYILAENQPIIIMWDNLDNTWAIEIQGIVFEGASAAELLREVATILEES